MAKRRLRQAPVLLCLMVLALLPAAGQEGIARPGSSTSPVAPFRTAAASRVSPGTFGFSADPRLEPEASQYARVKAGSLPGALQISQTPFEQRISMPLAGLWHGHMLVTGFASFDSMENVLWGPPASGSLQSLGITSPSHVGVWSPDPNQSYGLTITLHRKSPDAFGRSVHPERWLGRMLHLGRT